ncbi:uncharacterized protein BDW43DRAFT_294844 [Aspergillus alliaceus]|uniref:uncharacterized protein n=1 Tax=Petromyces alliaceus TaxID=209559 RepID=UPI0012A48EAE|nr:uncharacterized protein BDW43DRAFT_294844 [Aspergillus alliaceus]KAB8227118.1 hypothetical protein BDW43DRAFT_294844 [Aspergillus alliaceus]
MFKKRRSWASNFSQPATVNSSARAPTQRQIAPNRYLQRPNLQALLERLFPDHPDLDFHIRCDEEIWSFDAPREVTARELK